LLTSGIRSRSRSAGSYLRIGRRDSPGGAVAATAEQRRDGRSRSAGRYLRIGRAQELIAAARPALHDLRKVN